MAYNYEDPYAALGLKRSEIEKMSEADGAKAIKNAYKNQVSKAHPDRGGNPEDFKYYVAAYDILCNPSERCNPFFGWGSFKSTGSTSSTSSASNTSGTSSAYSYSAHQWEWPEWKEPPFRAERQDGARVTAENYTQFYRPKEPIKFDFSNVGEEQMWQDSCDPKSTFYGQPNYRRYYEYSYNEYWANHATGEPATSEKLRSDGKNLLDALRSCIYSWHVRQEEGYYPILTPLDEILQRVVNGRNGSLRPIPPESFVQIGLSDNDDASYPGISKSIYDMYLVAQFGNGLARDDANAICALARLTDIYQKSRKKDSRHGNWRGTLAHGIAIFCKEHRYELAAAMHALDPDKFILDPEISGLKVTWGEAYEGKRSSLESMRNRNLSAREQGSRANLE